MTLARPRHQAPTVELLQRFMRYYHDNPTWGSLHVILEDGNLHDSDVKWCLELAASLNDAEGEALAYELLKMSVTQRRKLYDGQYAVWDQAG